MRPGRRALPLAAGGAGVNRPASTRLPGDAQALMRGAMSDDRALRAIDRIERAFARIEAAAIGSAPAAVGEEELLALRHQHQALRGKVETAIAQIDRLLATDEVLDGVG